MREIYGYGKKYKDITKKNEYELLNQQKDISAKEMFEEANFKIYEETDDYITYRKYPNTIVDDDTYQEIFFNKIDKFVVIAEYHHGRQDEKFITLKEIQAINKQIEEFGWQ